MDIEEREWAMLDLEVLKDLVGDEPEILCSLLEEYQASLRSLSLELWQPETEIARVQFCAHRLKSASRSVGALPIGDWFAQLEQAAKAADLTTIEQMRAQGPAVVAAVLAQVEQALAGL